MDRLELHTLAEDLHCFVCGQANANGLKLRFSQVADRVEAEWTASQRLEGWPGLLHGGAFAALHDEAAAWSMIALAQRAGVTASMQIFFTRPIRIGDDLVVQGRVSRLHERDGTFATEIRRKDGTLLSRALTQYAFLDEAGMRVVLEAPLTPRFATWLRTPPEARRALLQRWQAEPPSAPARPAP